MNIVQSFRITLQPLDAIRLTKEEITPLQESRKTKVTFTRSISNVANGTDENSKISQ